MTEFERRFEELAEAARERFERAGEHDHLVYLFSVSPERPDLHEVPFGTIVHAMPGGNVDSKKERAYRFAASMMAKLGLPGYVEVAEFWIAAFKGSNQEVLAKYREAIKEHGSIKNTPGRIEMLLVHGRHGPESRSQYWRIGRRGKEVWLEHAPDGINWGGGFGKSAVLDQASHGLIRNRER